MEVSRQMMAPAPRILLVCVAVVLAAGCGNYKEKLQEAQQSIEKLTAESKALTDKVASLSQEKTKLSEDLASAGQTRAGLERQVADLKKANAALSETNAELQAKQNEARREMATLSRERTDLAEENERLKRQIASGAASETVARASKESLAGPRPSEVVTKPSEGLSPCNAVLEFMRKSEQAVRRLHGEERTKVLSQIRNEYTPKMQGAPDKALIASAAWVDELAKSWDKPGDKTVLTLLLNRNEVLRACNKTAAEAGF
jgi:flagellar hook-length control protein FliK